jgi:hypothetical protein
MSELIMTIQLGAYIPPNQRGCAVVAISNQLRMNFMYYVVVHFIIIFVMILLSLPKQQTKMWVCDHMGMGDQGILLLLPLIHRL